MGITMCSVASKPPKNEYYKKHYIHKFDNVGKRHSLANPTSKGIDTLNRAVSMKEVESIVNILLK